MNKLKKIGLFVVLVDFLSLTAYALYDVGLVGMVETVTSSSMSILLAVDLVIALVMVCVWMWNDAKARGKSALPYVLITACTGCAGPLLYLLLRDVKDEAHAPSGRVVDVPAT